MGGDDETRLFMRDGNIEGIHPKRTRFRLINSLSRNKMFRMIKNGLSRAEVALLKCNHCYQFRIKHLKVTMMEIGQSRRYSRDFARYSSFGMFIV